MEIKEVPSLVTIDLRRVGKVPGDRWERGNMMPSGKISAHRKRACLASENQAGRSAN